MKIVAVAFSASEAKSKGCDEKRFKVLKDKVM